MRNAFTAGCSTGRQAGRHVAQQRQRNLHRRHRFDRTCGVRSPGVSAVGTDYNNDRAIDLVLTGWAKTPADLRKSARRQIPACAMCGRMPSLRPPRQLPFSISTTMAGWISPSPSGAAPGITLWRNNQGKSFEPVELPTTNWARAWGVAAFDYDNDGWIDLVAVGETADGKGEVRLFRNLGPGRIQRRHRRCRPRQDSAQRSARHRHRRLRRRWRHRFAHHAESRSGGAAAQRRRQQEQLAAAFVQGPG